MTKEAIKKEIDRLRDEKNHLWNTMALSIGGSVTLMLTISLSKLLAFNLYDLFKLILIITGFCISYLSLNGYFYKDNKINKLIKNLKKEA